MNMNLAEVTATVFTAKKNILNEAEEWMDKMQEF
jgi:hypothetical protein